MSDQKKEGSAPVIPDVGLLVPGNSPETIQIDPAVLKGAKPEPLKKLTKEEEEQLKKENDTPSYLKKTEDLGNPPIDLSRAGPPKSLEQEMADGIDDAKKNPKFIGTKDGRLGLAIQTSREPRSLKS